MDTILSFFSDLILITAGLFVVFLWITLFVVMAIEIYDAFHESETDEDYIDLGEL